MRILFRSVMLLVGILAAGPLWASYSCDSFSQFSNTAPAVETNPPKFE